jgi:hypothetical protein
VDPGAPRNTRRVLVVGLVVLGLAACGLKGPLTLPSKSGEVTIRGPGQAAAAAPAGAAVPATDGAATPPVQQDTDPQAATPAPAEPAGAPPAAEPPKRRYDRLPPPSLPAGNPGTSRGG